MGFVSKRVRKIASDALLDETACRAVVYTATIAGSRGDKSGRHCSLGSTSSDGSISSSSSSSSSISERESGDSHNDAFFGTSSSSSSSSSFSNTNTTNTTNNTNTTHRPVCVEVWRGNAGPEEGHTVTNASSYFDRLWDKGEKKKRWFLYLQKL